jgi:hypothetical protein
LLAREELDLDQALLIYQQAAATSERAFKVNLPSLLLALNFPSLLLGLTGNVARVEDPSGSSRLGQPLGPSLLEKSTRDRRVPLLPTEVQASHFLRESCLWYVFWVFPFVPTDFLWLFWSSRVSLSGFDYSFCLLRN